MKKKRITIITGCRNAGQLLEDTVLSVVNQTAIKNGRAELEYLIYDALSNDGTSDYLKTIQTPGVTVVTEPDCGLYDAVAKGLMRATGDICAYINAGDYYHHTAFDVVLDVFAQHPAKWLTGYSMFYNEAGQLYRASLPFKFRRMLFETGLQRTAAPGIQQESTFWLIELNRALDFKKFRSFKLAGDYYLWLQFARVADPYIVQAHLGGFRAHYDQLSFDARGYDEEVANITQRPSLFWQAVAFFDRYMWYAPDGVKKRLNPRLLRFNNEARRWF